MEQWQIIIAAANAGDVSCQRIISDLQKNGQAAKRAKGGIHTKYAGTYAVAAAKVKTRKDKATAAASRVKVGSNKHKAKPCSGWTITQLKAKVFDLEEENKDLKSQVYHNVCIVSVCLSNIGVVS